jgi:hypothetical protein
LGTEFLSTGETSPPYAEFWLTGGFRILVFAKAGPRFDLLNFDRAFSKTHVDQIVSNLISVVSLEEDVTLFSRPTTSELTFQIFRDSLKIRSLRIQTLDHGRRLSETSHFETNDDPSFFLIELFAYAKIFWKTTLCTHFSHQATLAADDRSEKISFLSLFIVQGGIAGLNYKSIVIIIEQQLHFLICNRKLLLGINYQYIFRRN